MEMIKDIIIDFVLFSGVEGILYAMFYKIKSNSKYASYEKN